MRCGGPLVYESGQKITDNINVSAGVAFSLQATRPGAQ